MTHPRQHLIERIQQAEKEAERLREELKAHEASSIDWLGLWAKNKTIKETAAKHGIPYHRALSAYKQAWRDASPAQERKAKMQRAALGDLNYGVYAQFEEWEIPDLPIRFQIAYLEGCDGRRGDDGYPRDLAKIEHAVWKKLHWKVRAQFEDKRKEARAALAKHLWDNVRPCRNKKRRQRRERINLELVRNRMWADDVEAAAIRAELTNTPMNIDPQEAQILLHRGWTVNEGYLHMPVDKRAALDDYLARQERDSVNA